MQLKEQKASHWYSTDYVIVTLIRWKLREASIAAVGHLGEFICANLQSFDIQSFSQNVLALDLAPDSLYLHTNFTNLKIASDILRARSLWCASELSGGMSPEMVLPFVEGAAISLQTANAALPVKMSACKAVGTFSSQVSHDVMLKYLPTILTGENIMRNITDQVLLLFFLRYKSKPFILCWTPSVKH